MQTIAYGADYNPEQWDESVRKTDISLMISAGVNLVSVGIFSWSKLEPRPGEFDFGWLDAVIDDLHAAGIGVSLATATASPPPWMGALYPDTLPVDARGVRLTYGSRQQYSPSSATYRFFAARLVREIAERYKNHPALLLWHVNNEYGCHISESFDDESAEEFRTWLKSRYDTIEVLNNTWGTAFWSQQYQTWEEIVPPRAMPAFANPAQLLDWRRFSSDALLECYLTEVRILREITPEVPLTTNFMDLFLDLDYWKWAQHVDLVSNDSYPDPSDPRAAANHALSSDLMRSLGSGRPFLQLEQSPGQVQWRTRNARKRPGQFQLWTLQTIARGADGICQFQWRQSQVGSETFHAGMVPHAGTRSPIWQEAVETGRVLKRLSPVIGATIDAQVALVWDWESAWARKYAIGPDTSDPAQSVRDWHFGFFEANIACDFVHPSHDLSGYAVIVLPSLFQVGEDLAEKLDRAVRQGATIVIDHFTGVAGHDGQVHLGGYLGPLQALVGAAVLEVGLLSVTPEGADVVDPALNDTTQCPITATITVPSTAHGVDLISTVPGVARGVDWTEILDVHDAEVLATFAGADLDGQPALLHKQHGPGHVYYSATRLDVSSVAALIRRVAAEARVDRKTGISDGVEVVVRGDVHFYLNHSDEDRTVTGACGTDLLTGRPVEPEHVIRPRSVLVAHNPAA